MKGWLHQMRIVCSPAIVLGTTDVFPWQIWPDKVKKVAKNRGCDIIKYTQKYAKNKEKSQKQPRVVKLQAAVWWFATVFYGSI